MGFGSDVNFADDAKEEKTNDESPSDQWMKVGTATEDIRIGQTVELNPAKGQVRVQVADKVEVANG